ncbi:hypothetical protein F4809DRAFT_591978 [Biscogniauxia mediterranea]|nr:hypothetical protein F4809DRAFT_591978 [Biscogniauxia mediterranea]
MANISTEVVEDRIRQFGRLWMMDDLIRERARDEVQVPILGYPKYDDSASEYEFFTGKDLDRMVDEACRALVKMGLEVNSHKKIALFAPSDLAFIVTFFALFRLGCKVLMISIRLSEPACLSLLKQTGCDTILHGSTVRIKSTITGIAEAHRNLKLLPVLAREDFDKPDSSPEPFIRDIPDKKAEHAQLALLAHSSGSTGLPKPLALSHRSVISNLFSGTGCKAFNALPWYHLHGLFTSMQAMYMRKTAHLFNANLPLTADHLIAALKAVQPEICHTVPYALKLMAERDDGIEVLKRCKFVTAAGARTPDELGDRLVKEGVNFGVIFGLSEVGHTGDSIYREPGDDSWMYVRPYASLRSHMFFKKLDEGVYESVYLKSHPALMAVTSNSNDPPGSFHSRDLFTPHPTIENAWKYIARHDDRITLISGEKILPLSMEGAVRESPLVRDALMVGNDRLVPGLVVFRSQAAASFSEEEFIQAIWPIVETTNNMMDEFARITPDMIVSIAPDIDYPTTDKNSIIRAAATAKFETAIEGLYDKSRELHDTEGGKHLKLNIEELEKYILQVIHEHTGIQMPSLTADFFSMGIDSLRAAQIRRLLQKDLDLGGQLLPINVVYDAGNVAKLAGALYASRTGAKLENGHSNYESEITKMERLIAEYGKFETRKPGDIPTPEKDVVVLTGATGALGAHLLNQLLDDPKVAEVSCLVRGKDALGRITESMKLRGLSLANKDTKKLRALTTDNFGAPHLGLTPEVYSGLQNSVTLIIHAAWPVNFNISLTSFTPQIAGLRNFLDLASGVPFESPARVLFASSISAAFRMPAPASVPEGPLESLEYAASTGYARSKLVSERICAAAAASGGAAVGVLRVGQISADSANGIWNDKEHVPLLVRSATETGALPRLRGYEGRCEWMPVDTVAAAFLQLAEKLRAEAKAKANDAAAAAVFYNIVAPHAFSWNDEFLPALRAAGLGFEDVEVGEWLARLRARATELGPAAEAKLPAFKLADYYEDAYGGSKAGGAGSELRFEVGKACRDSAALRSCPQLSGVAIVRKMLDHWLGRDGH